MKSGISKWAINNALDDFEARAICTPITREVHVRVAGHDDNIYIDLGADTWEAVRVTGGGWSIVNRRRYDLGARPGCYRSRHRCAVARSRHLDLF